MKNNKQNDAQTNGNVVVAETPKPSVETTATEMKTKTTAPAERRYQLIAAPAIPPRGKQRQIVINALAQDKDRAFTIDEVTEFATKAGLTANAGVKASCMWHLHHLNKLGVAKIVNPTFEVEVPKQVETTTAA